MFITTPDGEASVRDVQKVQIEEQDDPQEPTQRKPTMTVADDWERQTHYKRTRSRKPTRYEKRERQHRRPTGDEAAVLNWSGKCNELRIEDFRRLSKIRAGEPSEADGETTSQGVECWDNSITQTIARRQNINAEKGWKSQRVEKGRLPAFIAILDWATSGRDVHIGTLMARRPPPA